MMIARKESSWTMMTAAVTCHCLLRSPSSNRQVCYEYHSLHNPSDVDVDADVVSKVGFVSDECFVVSLSR